MFEWIKKYKALIILTTIIILLGIPFLIHVLFKIKLSEECFITAEWSAGELLGYYGAILTFLGTLVLGFLALHQNQLIKEESDKYTQLMLAKELERNVPRFSVTVVSMLGWADKLEFYLENISENVANNIVISNAKILTADSNIYWEGDNQITLAMIPSASSSKITLGNPEIKEVGSFFKIEMSCKDKYNDTHSYLITGECNGKNEFPIFQITEV